MFGHITRTAITYAVAATATAAALSLAACGDSSSNSSGTAAKGANADVVAQVPAAAKGALTVAADATYAPNEFIGPDGKTVVGMDADLAKALATTMGLKAKVVNATFDAIIPGLAARKYDLGMSSFTDTKDREQTVDFVTYFSAGTSFFVKSGGPAVNALGDLCGHKVAVEKGTTQADDSTAQSKKCGKAGKGSVKVLVYPDQNGANLALSSGRADVSMADSPVAAYQVKQSAGAFKLSGAAYGTAPYGIAIPKKSGLAKPVLAALKALMADGTYASILKRWGVSSGAITDPVVNGATS
jgi:polar amino acid transport system substrate-binding protein